ncbi:F-box domain-containing protein [Mycena venus]|uniref:F-box domain-containing protein n=1 Tax=Mycena venus TaxID=2733690 RepID=A0A8H6X3K5_9AGAR|nr:F-box domain-containing protein [Mycena venus]
MLLLNVCNAWTGIALSTPALWADIYLEFPGVQILELWFRRAGNYALSVHLRRGLDYHVATSLANFSKQLKRLTVYEEQLTSGSLRGLVSFPHLETLDVGVEMDENNEFSAFSLHTTIRLLQLASNLVECTFRGLGFHYDLDTTDKVVLSRLRSLKFRRPSVDYHWHDYTGGYIEDRILKFLSLPALETLFLPFNISPADFASFLAYSSPPLQQLFLGDGCRRLSFINLEECLRLVPSVTRFELYVGPKIKEHLEDLFSVLVDSPSNLLPNLHTLKVQYNRYVVPTSVYQGLLHVLSARRAQIVSAHLINPNNELAMPSPEVLAGLQQLAAEGMDIHIGTPENNFISS